MDIPKVMSKLISHRSTDMNSRIPHQSNLCSVFTSLQNPHLNQCIFCHHARGLTIPLQQNSVPTVCKQWCTAS